MLITTLGSRFSRPRSKPGAPLEGSADVLPVRQTEVLGRAVPDSGRKPSVVRRRETDRGTALDPKHFRSLGELNVAIFNHFNPVASGIEEIKKITFEQSGAGGADEVTNTRPIIHNKTEVPVLVRMRRTCFHQRYPGEIARGHGGDGGADHHLLCRGRGARSKPRAAPTQ